MPEIWERLSYPGLCDEDNRFEVSSYGRLRNRLTGHIYSPSVLSSGYLCVRTSLGSRAKRINIIIHKAVAHTFIDNPNDYPEVNHINGNKRNNEVSNLEWCTRQDNEIHKYACGLIDIDLLKAENASSAKLSWDAVHDIRKNCILGSHTNGIRSFARKYGVCRKTVESVIHNKTWK